MGASAGPDFLLGGHVTKLKSYDESSPVVARLNDCSQLADTCLQGC